MRINPRDADPDYVEKGRRALYNDVSTEEYLRFAAYFNPDLPLAVAFDDARGTPERWGSVPRTFIRSTEDQTVPLALQDRMIAEADALTPGNRFESARSPRATRRSPRCRTGSPASWTRLELGHPGVMELACGGQANSLESAS